MHRKSSALAFANRIGKSFEYAYLIRKKQQEYHVENLISSSSRLYFTLTEIWNKL